MSTEGIPKIYLSKFEMEDLCSFSMSHHDCDAHTVKRSEPLCVARCLARKRIGVRERERDR